MGMEGDICYPMLSEEEKAWGKVASNVPDPPKCIENCRARFLERLVPGYDESKFSQACGVLSQDEQAKEKLWELYCCDSMACGVQLNQKLDLGQDPSVNLIINTCQNIGSSAIKDPGPPPSGYSCPAITASDDPDSIPCQRPFLVSDTRPMPSSTSTSPQTMSSSVSMTLLTSSTAATLSTQPAHPAVGTSGASSSTQSHESGGLPWGARIGVGVSCAIVFIAILAVAFCLFRRRRRRRGYTQSIKSEIKHYTPPPASSPTPLISPTASTHEGINSVAPLTPPPRLKERRLLPNSLSPTASSVDASISGTPLVTPIESRNGSLSSSLPQSPAFAPMSSKLAPPRRLRTPIAPGYSPSPPPTWFAGKSVKTASMSSAASARTATTVSNVSSGFPYLTPSSPSRPPRPHEAPLYIPDLVCPGPPPTRSLPPAPPVSPASPASPLSPLRYQTENSGGDGGGGGGSSSSSSNSSNSTAAVFVPPPRNPARGVVLGKESRDLCDLTESCTRQSRESNSWGSWEVGAGATGSAQKGAGRVNSPVLEEADLERMGGRY